MQSRRASTLEAVANVVSGFAVSWCLGMLVFPLFGFPVSAVDNFWIVAAFTVTSFLRSYLWRRVFNRLGTTSHG